MTGSALNPEVCLQPGAELPATFQELQNLTDLYSLELRENKYNKGFGSQSGYTVIKLNPDGQRSKAAHIPQDMGVADAAEWIKEFADG